MESADTLRLLDRRIGTAVLGYHIHSEGSGSQRYYVLLDGNNGIVARQTSSDDGGRTSEAAAWDDCPHFSSELALTNAMLDAVEAKLPGAEMVMPGAAGADGRFTAYVRHNGREVSGTGGSMESAICRAVLALVDPRPPG